MEKADDANEVGTRMPTVRYTGCSSKSVAHDLGGRSPSFAYSTPGMIRYPPYACASRRHDKSLNQARAPRRTTSLDDQTARALSAL
jgi:hypothetical protein